MRFGMCNAWQADGPTHRWRSLVLPCDRCLVVEAHSGWPPMLIGFCLRSLGLSRTLPVCVGTWMVVVFVSL